MRTANISLQEILTKSQSKNARKPAFLLQFQIGLPLLCRKEDLTKSSLQKLLGKRPNEITRWLSGEHNFTISTLAMLSTFFGKSIINV